MMGCATYHEMLDEDQAEVEAVHSLEDAFMIPGMGAQPVPPAKYNPANDNEPGCRPVGHKEPPVGWRDTQWDALHGKPHVSDNGRYIGLTRRSAGRDGDPNGCADDLVGWSAVPANSPGKGNPFEHVGTRTGDFMQTFSGRKFWPADPRPDEVHIEDIAHSLSLQCRYAGHCLRFYSVAEHCVLIARWLLKYHCPHVALAGLLHDATEAYLVDVPRPAKASLPDYKRLEAAIWTKAIAPRFGLCATLPPEVHEADNRIIADELVNLRRMDWHARHTDGLGVSLEYMSPDRAETEFLALYVRLERMIRGVGGME